MTHLIATIACVTPGLTEFYNILFRSRGENTSIEMRYKLKKCVTVSECQLCIQIVRSFALQTCPWSSASEILRCAASGLDHTECCKREKVLQNCLGYCNPHGGTPHTSMMEAYQCLVAFKKIRKCFKRYEI